MAGLYNRMVDPNFIAPNRGGVAPNAGVGAPGPGALQRPQEDDFNAAQMAGLLGMMAKQKEQPGSAAPGTAPTVRLEDAQPGMTPITNEGNFDWQPAMAQGTGALPNGGNFAMPPAGSGDAFQLGNVGGAAPLMSNFGAGVPQAAAPQGIAMPTSIGGAGVPTFGMLQGQPGIVQSLLGRFGGGFGGMG